jgi:hypothetical protein
VAPLSPALVALASRVAIMPRLRALAIDPGNHVVVLGQLTVAERVKLVNELRAGLPVPVGAPSAGLGGVSTSDGDSDNWLLVGAGFLLLSALSGVTGMAFGRRRNGSS